MNRTLFVGVAAIVVAAASCKSRESTEVTVTNSTGSGSATDPVAPAAKPTSTTRERLEKSLKKNLGDVGFTTFTCPEVGATESETTCTASAANGVSLPVKIQSTAKDDDGRWKSWKAADSDVRMITAEELADKIRDGVAAAVTKAHPKATSDLACGTSPIVFVSHKATCKLTMHKPDKVVEITIDDSKGQFDWSADAF